MRKLFPSSYLLVFLLLITNACVAAPDTLPTASPVPVPASPAMRESPVITPVESAFAPGNPTAVPLDDIVASHTVAFETPDGATISGELYGSGKTAVVFSVMGNCKPGWRELAWLTAAQGLMAFTYRWRDCGESGPVSEAELSRNFLNDARGAINFVREQGAQKIILAGASLGGMASARLARESQANGIVIVASPRVIPQWGFEIESADLNMDIPKLFITAENDPTVPASATRQLHDLAAEPKAWQTYPGYKHGTDLFDTESRDAMQKRIVEFFLEIAFGN